MELTEEQIERFWEKVNKNGANGCWIWTGGKFAQGYGKWRTKHSGPQYSAHRVSFFLVKGFLPERGLVLDHLCEVRACVNPSDLNVTTIYLNCARSEKRKTALPITPGGVNRHGNGWQARLHIDGKRIYIGRTNSKEGAIDLLHKYHENFHRQKPRL